MIIDCISDLHGHYPQLEGGDLLIVAGDLTARDENYQYVEFLSWLNNQVYKKIILIAGNHENRIYDKEVIFDPLGRVTYLCDSGTEFEGLKIWGSPWTKTFPGMNPDCKAFTVDTEEQLADKWGMIPDDTDILVTHSPPCGILDVTGRQETKWGKIDIHCGSKSLRNKVLKLEHLKLNCFGHIHESYNTMTSSIKAAPRQKIRHPIFVNASHVNERYEPVNKPIRIEL